MKEKLLAKKPIDLILAEAEEREGGLRRVLGPISLTVLGIGAIIGAGIFVLTGLAAHTYAGPALMLSFVISGLGCAFAALSYAEFAAMIPLAGSAYTYAYATLGELFAWIIGWDLILEYTVAAAAVSSGWSNYFVKFLELFHVKLPLWITYDYWTAKRIAMQSSQILSFPTFFGIPIAINLPAALIVLTLTILLVIGIKESARFNAVIVAIKVSVVLFVIFAGIAYINPQNWGTDWKGFAPYGLKGIWQGAAYIFFAYIGFDAISTVAQETRNPQKDLPIGIIASLGICTILYICVAAVLTGMVYYKEINIEAPLADAFLKKGLHAASSLISAGALAGLTSVMLVMLLGQPRIYYSMASDGLLPRKFFAAVHSKFRTPYKATILTGSIVSLMGGFTPIEDLAKLVNIGTLLAFIIVCTGVIVLRYTNPNQYRPFRCPLVPLVPILGVLFNGYMMYNLGWVNWLRLMIWLVIGLSIYFSYSIKRSIVRGIDAHWPAASS